MEPVKAYDVKRDKRNQAKPILDVKRIKNGLTATCRTMSHRDVREFFSKVTFL